MVSFKDKLKQQNTGEIYIKPDWTHPGFPRIGAIKALKENTTKHVKKEIDMRMQEIELMSSTYEGMNGPALRTKLYDIMRTHKTSSSKFRPTMGFSAYFNSNEMKTGIEAINKAIKEKISFAMQEGARIGVETTKLGQRYQRKFKSNIMRSERSPGDLYATIYESLRTHKVGDDIKENQFVTMRAGSYDIGDSESNPTGIRGSRMHRTDASLVELTEEGTGRFKLASGFISEGTKRIKRNLKGIDHRDLAGRTRYRRRERIQ